MKLIKTIKFRVMRQVLNRNLRNVVASFTARKIGKNTYKTNGSSFLKDQEVNNHAKELNEIGYTEFKVQLEQETISKLRAYLETIKCYDPYLPEHGDFDIADVPASTHTAHYHRNDLVKNDIIMNIANDEGILNLVQDFLKAKPTISNINAWWSFAGKTKAEQAQLFHRDLDDYKFCKLFIYLTDVSADSGPHVFVKNSSNSNKLSKIRRYADEEVEAAFGKENIIEIVRPAGASFVVNTYGFHKGLLPAVGNRLLLQVQYSLNPIEIETYKPVEVTDKTKFKNYTNRLLIK